MSRAGTPSLPTASIVSRFDQRTPRLPPGTPAVSRASRDTIDGVSLTARTAAKPTPKRPRAAVSRLAEARSVESDSTPGTDSAAPVLAISSMLPPPLP